MGISFITLLCIFLIKSTLSNTVQSSHCLPDVGTKKFCTDTEAWRTWFQAEEFCKSKGTGWTLASIETEDEYNNLKAGYNSGLFYGDYWISGRDIQDLDQFVWNFHTASRPGNLDSRYILFLEPKVETKYQTCLVYSSLPNQGSGLGFWPCANQLATLCEGPA